MRSSWIAALGAAAALQLAFASPAPPAPPAPQPSGPTAPGRVPRADGELLASTARIPRSGVTLALRDVDGDGAADLLRFDGAGVSLRLLRDGRFGDSASARLAWPTDNLAWDLSDLDGDGRAEVTALVSGREVRTWRYRSDGGFGPGETLLEAASYLPAGVTRMNFVRDVDGDGRPDVVLPAAGHYMLHLQHDDGWAPPIRVVHDARISYDVGDPASLDGSFAQHVTLPWFTIEDVDGDGLADLIARREDEVAFHLAGPKLPAEPTWVLDLAALRDELPEQQGIDFDDLLANVAHRVEWRLEDMDGVYPRDVVLMIGSTFKVHLGAALGGPQRSPDQVLKSSGNVLYFFLRDVQGDALPELQLVRGERISLGRVLRYLILPGKLDFDLFTYLNQGGTLSRKPTKRTTLALKIPRLLTLIEKGEEFGEEFEQAYSIPAQRVAFDADGVANDVVDLRGSELVVYRDCAPEQPRGISFAGDDVDEIIESLILNDLDALQDGGTKTIDLGDLEALKLSVGAELRQYCEGREPALRQPFGGSSDGATLHLGDFDGDGVTDFLVVGETDAGHVATFLMRRFPD